MFKKLDDMKKAIDSYKTCRLSVGKGRYSCDSRPSSHLVRVDEKKVSPLIRESLQSNFDVMDSMYLKDSTEAIEIPKFELAPINT